jgi:hypothetical protein
MFGLFIGAPVVALIGADVVVLMADCSDAAGWLALELDDELPQAAREAESARAASAGTSFFTAILLRVGGVQAARAGFNKAGRRTHRFIEVPTEYLALVRSCRDNVQIHTVTAQDAAAATASGGPKLAHREPPRR